MNDLERLEERCTDSMSRRQFVAGVAALGAASTAVGLVGHADAASRALRSLGRGQLPASATTLNVAIASTPPSLDSDFISQFIEHETVENLYDRLFELKIHGAQGFLQADTRGIAPVNGQLAASWSASHDKRTFTIHLRKGVRSAVGHELTAQDVKWTIDRALALKANGPFYLGQINLLNPNQVRVLDRYTVQMHLSAPSVLFYKIFTLPHLAIKDSVEAKKHTTSSDPWAANWLKTNSAGFGPYSVRQFTPGSQLVMVANPHYHGGKITLSQVSMRVVPSSGNRLALIESGDVDIAENLAPQELASLRNASGVRVVSVSPANLYSWIAMETATPPFNDQRVRQAVAYAIPYDKILRNVYLGTARQQMSPVPTIYEFYTGEFWTYKTNPTKAKQLLKAAGHANGFSSSIGFSSDDPSIEQIAILAKEGLSAVGINVELNKLPLAAYVQKWLGGQLPMSISSVGPAVADPIYAMALWWYSKKNILDFTKYHNPQVDSLIERARSQFDNAKRRADVRQIQRLIMDDAPMAFVADIGAHYGVRTNVGGFNWYPDQGVRYWRLHKS